MFPTIKRALAIGAAAAVSLAMTACGGRSSADSETISIGIPSGWDEGIVVSNMVAASLEEQGYTVEMTDADIGVTFTGLASKDYDLMLDGWLPVTHKDYFEQYGEQIEDLGVWYDNAKLALAVNSDAPITSIDELADNADTFGNVIIGIDSGAGITRLTQDAVIPDYGLDQMDFKISSTAAMLTELKATQDKGQNIVVTLWSPHWAYSAFDIRDLKDPKGAYGQAEEIHAFARQGFSEDHPEIATMLGDFTLSADELADVENYVINENGGKNIQQDTKDWLEQNPEVKDRLKLG